VCILNNFSPLPLKNEPDERNTLPLNIEPLFTEVTTNPASGETEAVTLPLTINDDNKASSVSAERGISNNNLPEELTKEPLAIKILPVNSEPLAADSTLNP